MKIDYYTFDPNSYPKEVLISAIDELQHFANKFLPCGEDFTRYRRAFGLTPQEAYLLHGLITSAIITREKGEALLSLASGDHARDYGSNIHNTRISTLRKKLKNHGVFIETVWGTGHRMNDENKKTVKSILEQAND